MRAALVGCLVVAVTAAGLFSYRYFTLPRTMTIAAGAVDGEPVRLMSAIAGRLTKSNSSIRLKIVALGNALEAAKAFSAGEADLAIVRADVGDLSNARTVVVISYGVVLLVVPPGSSGTMESLKGKTIGVVGEEINRNLVEELSREYDFAGAKVRVKDIAVADAQQAFRSRQVSALLMVTPTSEKYLALIRGVFAGDPKRRPQLLPIESPRRLPIPHRPTRATSCRKAPCAARRPSPTRTSRRCAFPIISSPTRISRGCDCRADEGDHGCAQRPPGRVSASGAGQRTQHRQGRIHSCASRSRGFLRGHAATLSG